jgi:hypothetical protein
VIGLPLPPFGREVAQRQHRGIGAMNPSAGSLEQKAVVGRAQRGRLIVDQVQVAPAAQARDRVREQMRDVGAIHLAPDEAGGEAGIVPSCPLLLRAPREPAREVVRLVGERAHVLDGHIQQMLRIAARVGQTPAEPGGALDQVDAIVAAAAPQQVQGHQNAAEAAPDDCDAAGTLPHAIEL